MRVTDLRRWWWITLVAIMAATVIGLRFEGRRWWCRLGDWLPWSLGVRTEHTSQHFFDPYSLTHVLHGVVLYAALHLVARRLRPQTRLLLTTALECLWELIENSRWAIDRYRTGTVSLDYTGDSVLNSLGDISSCVLGFLLAQSQPVRWSICLFLVVELGLLIAYRDNLLLNVIMLIHSFDGIKTWQAG